ncbi:unnamed protein product [Trichobilharzia regenti]|nr:unnamed protein product [Trichobilharzia regenti]
MEITAKPEVIEKNVTLFSDQYFEISNGRLQQIKEQCLKEVWHCGFFSVLTLHFAIQRTNQLMSDNHLSEERINHGNTENSNPSYKTSISVKDEHVEETEEIDGNTSASLFESAFII